MIVRRWLVVLLLLLANAGVVSAQERISHGYFDRVPLYRPVSTPTNFVLFLSGDEGWTPRLAGMAGALTQQGALVAGIDLPKLLKAQREDGATCVFPDGDLENLSRYLQAYLKLPTYLRPLLVGVGSGGSLAYALSAQSSPDTFSGVLTLGFCPEVTFAPLCKGEGVHFHSLSSRRSQILMPSKKALPIPWTALHGEQDGACPVSKGRAFVAQVPGARWTALPRVDQRYAQPQDWLSQYRAAFASFGAQRASAVPSPPADLADLPIVEVQASAPVPASEDRFAILLSGDGGWAGLDRDVADALAAHGIPVAGVDSLRYFWTPRTPEGLGKDLDRLILHYAARWQRARVLLIGYSQGADVLPFGVNRLPAATKPRVARTVLMGLGQKAAFEFHLSNWIGSSGDRPIQPEASKLSRDTALCLYGKEEEESLCPHLAPHSVTAIELPGGHHFDGDYEKLATLILQAPASRSPR